MSDYFGICDTRNMVTLLKKEWNILTLLNFPSHLASKELEANSTLEAQDRHWGWLL